MEMTFNYTPLFILPLVGGFVFIKEWEGTRYILPREDGHKLYFRSAYCGLFVCIAAFFSLALIVYVAAIIPWRFSSSFADYSGNLFDLRLVFMTLLASPVLGYVFARFLNIFTDELNYYYTALQDNEFEYLLVKAMSSDLMVMVTMEDEKVYVGWVYKVSDPAKAERKYFSLIPVMSGCRAEKRKVEFTTFYDEVYRRTDDELGHLDVEHFAVVLPAQRMLSARLFDPEAYDSFQEQELKAG